MLDAREVFGLLLAPREATDWWAHLDGEDNKKNPEGRHLVDTLSAWFIQRHRDAGRGRERRQYFFSPDARSCVDRRFDGVAIEEKVIELKYNKLVDGALGRSLVWVLGGRPKEIAQSDAAAIGLCVTKGAAPMSSELTNAFISVVIAAQHENVHVIFVHGDSGDHWPKKIGGRDPLPPWLSKIDEPSTWELEPPSLADVEALEEVKRPMTMKNVKLFGMRPYLNAEVGPTGKKIAIAAWSNHWQMLDVALTLRGLGYAAVKMFYSGREKLVPAGRGVEENIRIAMKLKFRVVLDWRVAPV